MLSFLSVKVDILLKPRGLTGLILALYGLSLCSNQGQGIAESFDSVGRTFPCFLTLGLVCLLDRLKSYIFQQSFCNTSIAYFWLLLLFLEQQDSRYVSRAALVGILDPPPRSIPFYHLFYTFVSLFC